jgi:hypothetical protein
MLALIPDAASSPPAAMGGTIGVESAPGRGSRFTVVIPVQLCSVAASASYESPQKKLRTSASVADAATLPQLTPVTPAAPAPRAGSAEPAPALAVAGAAASGSDAVAAAQAVPEAGAGSRRLRVLLVDDHQLNLVRSAALGSCAPQRALSASSDCFAVRSASVQAAARDARRAGRHHRGRWPRGAAAAHRQLRAGRHARGFRAHGLAGVPLLFLACLRFTSLVAALRRIRAAR